MKKIRIGTRKSPLALWQANRIAEILEAKGCKTEIVPITSEGDKNLKQPIYTMGMIGVFTRALDIALLNDKVDIAVHSLKDVPTILPKGLVLRSCLERANPRDILVYKSENIFDKPSRTIATGSLRRIAFWKNRYPSDKLVDLRGNIQLRLQKLIDNKDWDAAIFAMAGLNRSEMLIELESKNLLFKELSWMLPAPSQGILGVVTREEFEFPNISDTDTEICATVERQFLNVLEGGCTAPIGALVVKKKDEFHFKGAILTLDGREVIEIERKFNAADFKHKGKEFAEECIKIGAREIIEEIKKELSQRV